MSLEERRPLFFAKGPRSDAQSDDPLTLPSPSLLEAEVPRRRVLCLTLPNKTATELEIGLLVLGTLVFGGLNRVLGKIISVPMGDFSFFLGSFNGLFYALFYYVIILVRYFVGNIDVAQIKFPWSGSKHSIDIPASFVTNLWRRIGPWKWFLLMGLNDGLANVLGLLAQPHVSGTMTALASQLIVLFSAFAALVLLGTRYTFWQMWSILLVLAGVVVTLLPTFEGQSEGSDVFFTVVMMFSTLPNAISFTLKEKLFIEEPSLDIFVVNSTASLFQLLLQPLFLPLTLIFNQTMGLPFLDYIRDGFMYTLAHLLQSLRPLVLGLTEFEDLSCFVGKHPPSTKNDCSPNPYPYLIYIGINIIFNLLILMITKRASALLGFMAIKAVLPISVVLFFINWPLIGSAPLSYFTLAGLVVVLAALVVFRIATLHRDKYKLGCGSCYVPSCKADPLPLSSGINS